MTALAHAGCATSDVRPMTDAERDAVLAMMGLAVQAPTAVYLERLHWAFLKASPFHNLELLAGISPRTPDGCIAAVVAGRGGPCHVQAAAFVALLLSLRFDAHLVAATIGEPGDHLVVLVHTHRGALLCDVGNGHPYRYPFPLHGRRLIEHLGWRFAADGTGSVFTLRRRLDDGTFKIVYTVDPTPRRFEHFAGIIDGHHEQDGFGPFLTGLRAVHIGDDRVVTLRNFELRRYGIAGVTERHVADRDAATRVLRQLFGLKSAPIDAAFARLGDRINRWPVAPQRMPRIVVVASITGRLENLRRLLSSFAEEWSRTSWQASEKLLVVLVENSPKKQDRAANAAIVERHRGNGRLDVRLVDDGEYARPIAMSRRRQVQALAALRGAGVPFDVAWMVDDDVELKQLRLREHGIETTADVRYFDRIAELYDRRPEASVLVGGVCGDPPIRPEAVLVTQLLDVISNLERLSAMAPDEPYRAPLQRASFALPDYYYDHSRAGVVHLSTPFLWQMSDGSPCSTAAAAVRYISAASGMFAGKTPTRPLVYAPEPPAADLQTSVLRGGNTVFLDVDALFGHTYPAVQLGDVTTRRSDMVGATLLARRGAAWPAAFAFPVLHVRCPDPDSARSVVETRSVMRRSLIDEFYGVLLARAVMDSNKGEALAADDLMALASERATLVMKMMSRAAELADRALTTIAQVSRGWLGDDDRAARGLAILGRRIRHVRDAWLGGGDRAELDAWLSSLRRDLLCTELIARIHAFSANGLAEVEDEQRAVMIASLNGACDG